MRRKIQKKLDMVLSLIIIVVLLPFFVATIGQRMELEELIYGKAGVAISEAETGIVETEVGIGSAEINMEEIEQLLIGIVAKEISADAEEEAILAQCVIARTNLCDAREKHTKEPESLTAGEMQELWGEHFKECYSHIEACVKQTKGEVLCWEGDYAYAAYHAISAGSTRNMQTLYGDVRMPYLKAQECEADAVAEGYLAVSYWEKTAFVEECNRLFAESEVTAWEDVTIESRDEAGYVLAMKVGSVDCNGEAFREAFGLNSACFTIAEVDNKIRIVTKGLGHGFGLSQNTANEMAKNGSDYREILSYFFPGTTLETMNKPSKEGNTNVKNNQWMVKCDEKTRNSRLFTAEAICNCRCNRSDCSSGNDNAL